ncbi:MAG TPA: hypothetical protein VGA17_08370 [Nitrospiraceae bacterium]
MTPGKVWGGLIVLFLAGMLTGIGGMTLYHQYEQERRWERGPAAKQERVMKLLTRELSLSPAQQADIEPIVGRSHVEILELRFSHHPEVEQTLAKRIAEIKTKLSAEQQTQLDGLYAKLQRRWQISLDYLASAKKGMNPLE